MTESVMPCPVLTIDGPSGVGKGTVAKILARELGWHYLDSGALYRIVACAAMERGVDLTDGAALAVVASDLDVSFDLIGPDGEVILLAGHDITAEVRSEACSRGASIVAARPEVRAALLTRQKQFRQLPGLVAEGRDMGTVVFPDAALKIFLTASPEERALRRHKQLNQKGLGVSLSALSQQMQERDQRDSSRAEAPLVAAADALQVDTTQLSVEQVVAVIRDLAKKVAYLR
ncbi:MAG: (d)CMP kinase [Gammaproteobacteria bacterium]|nr:(d)CMP kinase [Gammaproteobacteria bacterium]